LRHHRAKTGELDGLAADSQANYLYGIILKAKDEAIAFANNAMNEAKVLRLEERKAKDAELKAKDAELKATYAALAEERKAKDAELKAKDAALAEERKAKDAALAEERKAKDAELKAKDAALAEERKATYAALAEERKATYAALAEERKAKAAELKAKDAAHTLQLELRQVEPRQEKLLVRFVFGACVRVAVCKRAVGCAQRGARFAFRAGAYSLDLTRHAGRAMRRTRGQHGAHREA
jgi:hypothetical protein